MASDVPTITTLQPPAIPTKSRLTVRRIATGAGALVIVLGAAAWYVAHRAVPVHYTTALVTRGDVATTLTASGTVNPVVTVQVGTYVSGTIIDLPCDYNTQVRKGQLCAKINPAPYQIIVDEDQAQLASAQAQLIPRCSELDSLHLGQARAALEHFPMLMRQHLRALV